MFDLQFVTLEPFSDKECRRNHFFILKKTTIEKKKILREKNLCLFIECTVQCTLNTPCEWRHMLTKALHLQLEIQQSPCRSVNVGLLEIMSSVTSVPLNTFLWHSFKGSVREKWKGVCCNFLHLYGRYVLRY